MCDTLDEPEHLRRCSVLESLVRGVVRRSLHIGQRTLALCVRLDQEVLGTRFEDLILRRLGLGRLGRGLDAALDARLRLAEVHCCAVLDAALSSPPCSRGLLIHWSWKVWPLEKLGVLSATPFCEGLEVLRVGLGRPGRRGPGLASRRKRVDLGGLGDVLQGVRPCSFAPPAWEATWAMMPRSEPSCSRRGRVRPGPGGAPSGTFPGARAACCCWFSFFEAPAGAVAGSGS